MSRFWLFILWLAYFIFPFDLIPDMLPVMGRLEDLGLLLLLYWFGWRKRGQKIFGSQSRASYGGAGGYGAYGNHSQSRGNDQARQEKKEEIKDPYKILELDASASPEEIKHAYRVQAGRYHPDKVSHLGAEFQELAKKKFQDVQWAYEELVRRKGKA